MIEHHIFVDRLCEAVEKELRIGRNDRGFRFAIAKKLGLGNSTIQRWFDGSFPEARHLMKIYDAFSVSPEYLIGISNDASFGVKTVTDPKFNIQFGNKIKHLFTDSSLTSGDHTGIPIFEPEILTVLGGVPITNITQKSVRSWLVVRSDLVKNRRNVIGVTVSKRAGDGMSPVIKPGDIVLIDLDDIEVMNDQIYAVTTPTGCTIRMVRVCDSTYILLPLNLTNHQVQTIDTKEIKKPIIGRVIQSLTILA